MGIDDLFDIIKKKGFRDTFQVLSQFKNYRTDKHSFYNELNKFSYYNSFFRVKEDLVNRGIIRIEEEDKGKIIKLTDKGLDVYNKLLEISNIIEPQD